MSPYLSAEPLTLFLAATEGRNREREKAALNLIVAATSVAAVREPWTELAVQSIN